MNRHAAALLGLLILMAGGCSRTSRDASIEPLDNPAPPGSVFPSLVVDRDRVLLSWTEPEPLDGDPRVRFAALEHGEWSAAETIGASSRLFVNWADFASMAVDGNGSLGAQWLVRGVGSSWAYGIRFAVRGNDGEWSVPSIPHGKAHPGEQGFVSLLSEAADEFEMVWLDGREMERGGAMELRQTVWKNGQYRPERILDQDVCTCCQTDAASFEAERFVAYRDHAAGEIRDISYVRFDGESWSPPTPLSGDGWQIGACPVNGPAVAARERALAVAWFTQAQDQPRVWIKRSNDFGAVFGDAIRLDEGDPIGRVDAVILADSSLVVVWLERVEGEGQVSLRRIEDDRVGPVVVLGRTAAHRESGFPRIATDGSNVWAAWTDTSRPTRVRLARIAW